MGSLISGFDAVSLGFWTLVGLIGAVAVFGASAVASTLLFDEAANQTYYNV